MRFLIRQAYIAIPEDRRQVLEEQLGKEDTEDLEG